MVPPSRRHHRQILLARPLSADTLEGLKYLAEIQQRNGGTVVVQCASLPAKGGLGLADCGSDEDD